MKTNNNIFRIYSFSTLLFLSSAQLDAMEENLSLDEIAQLAEQGNPEAQFRLGHKYYIDCTPEDYEDEELCLTWYHKAAVQGHVLAQFNLACLHAANFSYEIAFEWFKKAADQEYTQAQLNVGRLYNYGQGTKRDAKKALEYFTKYIKATDKRLGCPVCNKILLSEQSEEQKDLACECSKHLFHAECLNLLKAVYKEKNEKAYCPSCGVRLAQSWHNH